MRRTMNARMNMMMTTMMAATLIIMAGSAVLCIAAADNNYRVDEENDVLGHVSNIGIVKEGLTPHFYRGSCPGLQWTVASSVALRLTQDPSAAGPLLRLFFHDCFVHGCDASILLRSNPNNSSEIDALPNRTLRELDLVDGIKEKVEKICPNVVSCADILALIAKEVVAQSGGPDWFVELGRKDGCTSNAFDATNDLPSSLSSAQLLIDIFHSNGLTIRDMVTLSGAHTIGKAHCFQVARRFYGFINSTYGIDPTLNMSYAKSLKASCPLPINLQSTIALDPLSPNIFDNQYYKNLLLHKGLFTSDSALILDNRTKKFVHEYAHDERAFFQHFVSSMVKLGRLRVITSNSVHGEIRKHCRRVNSLDKWSKDHKHG